MAVCCQDRSSSSSSSSSITQGLVSCDSVIDINLNIIKLIILQGGSINDDYQNSSSSGDSSDSSSLTDLIDILTNAIELFFKLG